MIPLAAYLAVVGLVNLRPRPLVATGASDTIALGLGLVGLVWVGPIELFRPEPATAQFLNYVWPILIALYLLGLVLVAMVSRPRLVVYNMTIDELRPMLNEGASNVDSSYRWAGDSLVLPKLGVQLHLESFALLRNTSLVANGPHQSLEGWRRLDKQFRASLRSVQVRPHPPGIALLVVAAILVAMSEMRLAAGEAQVVAALEELFGFGWERS